MKSSDGIAIVGIALALALFTVLPDNVAAVNEFSQAHGFLMSFLKFAILGTAGEMVALRITTKKYIQPGFGVLPRALMWGVIGLLIHTAFTVYASGTPVFLKQAGFSVAPDDLVNGSFLVRLGVAFSISTLMNILFAPLFMLAHGVVSMHIEKTGGTLRGLFSPLPVSHLLDEIDWNMLWGFVFRKTIPFFWIPAHTVTFMLPPELRVLFAAALGVVLGVILAFASLKSVPATT
ncbi:Mpv17/PMP22 family protein [Oceanidesulfovibrio marinus]|uniref:Mpv17/PMP22 family protein n=1 Tax=Oceanidesulfovibrio marinus TaxID=370038 RepID=A0ABX6NBV9_9BACT|nr:Mpv17/PMP22 family protein [Oceanidesulfovibrio marinus]QJT08077.1 Mpv17/PMP22 family protein [Oceanidesulfovibrio marinus]